MTILFADLSGSTVLGERLDPEVLRGILASYFNELARQIRRYEGTLDKYVGDAVMAVFGAPISHEDDAERAINAALAMQTSIAHLNDELARQHGVRLALRIGINTGEVVAGLLAGDVQTAYTVVGDAVNTAQRYEAAAPLGEILVSATTRRLAIHSFEFEETAPLTLKGKAERVVAYRVLRRRYEEIAPESTLFVGRDRELALLRDAVTDAVEGRGRVIDIVGEAGVGKSRLVGELRAGLVAAIDRLVVRCASFETNTPYALVADLVRGAFGIHAADAEDAARGAIVRGFEVLGAVLDETSVDLLLDVLGYRQRSAFAPDVKRRILVGLLRALLGRESARTPLVITAEDLHWVDSASIAVLAELVRDVPSLPLLFLTTSRPGWTAPWKGDRIELTSFDAAEAHSLIEAIFEVPVEEALSDLIVGSTGGNPFFIEEVARELMASTVLVERLGRVALRHGAVVETPPTVREVLEARLDRLEGGPRRTLQLAAVCGRTFWYRILQRLAPDANLTDDLAVLEQQALIVPRATTPEMTYAFRQSLIQEVAYQTQLQSHRRETHGAIAAAVEDLYAERLDEFVDLLAYHYQRSDDAPKAISYLLRAGDRARKLYANDEALRYYGALLELATDASTRELALEGLGDVRATLGELGGARAVYEEALGLGGSRIAHARLLRKIAFTHNRAGDYRTASELLRRSLETVGDARDPEVATIYLSLAEVTWRQDRFDEAIIACARGIEAAKASGARHDLANGFRILGLAHLWKGERAIAAEHFRRALELYESLGDLAGLVGAHNNLSIVHRRESRWSDALREQEEALRIARRIGDAWMVATVLGNMGESYRYQGDYEKALAAYQESLRGWTEVGDAVGVSLQHMNVGILMEQQGRHADARNALAVALAEFERLDSRRFLPELHRTFALAQLGDDLEAALLHAERSIEVARDIKARDDEGLALQVLGQVRRRRGELELAARALRESVVVLRETNSRLDLARTLVLLVEVLREGHPEAGEVRSLAAEAAALFSEAGATKERTRAESLAAV